MGHAIEMGQREQLIAFKQQEHPLLYTSEHLQLPFLTVRNLSARYRREGHLRVGYANCAPKEPTSETLLQRASLWLKRRHPQWGAP